MMNVSTSAPNRPTALPDGSVRFTAADTRSPAVGLLSNGRYSVMISAAGAGYSSWRDLDVTRWREDGTRDCWGQFCYVRDARDGAAWSVGHQPLGRAGGLAVGPPAARPGGGRVRSRLPPVAGRLPPPRRGRGDAHGRVRRAGAGR